ncbi:PIN domain-containing protein [Conexibacter sp. W3-3-2]|uniref:PIN domain-containing protein n=1 Tax=Conexibacter sp. W3-3-2 TaxID=2675227 RepID=UPI0012B97748|nr:PIN domain-containing protein [Conexibacter sp. W3-3-2]
MNVLALDTSVAIALLVETGDAHASAMRWLDGREACLCGHAWVETYSVLTRLPGDLRVAPADAAALLRRRFAAPLTLRAATARRVPDLLAPLGLGGGAVYDALVALAAKEHGIVLATRDARARPTYEAVGARVEIVV